ncbi:MAG: proteinase inhibitor [Alphaproteobacteria bacterium]|nr:proteinase inhibitor [Alphaproteobacteria bacterium]
MSPRALLATLCLAACTTTEPTAGDTDTGATGTPEVVAGSCLYTNAFSRAEECKEYRGAAWTAETADADCQAPLAAAGPGTFTADAPCSDDGLLGTCTLAGGTDEEAVLHFPGSDPDACSGLRLGCSFAEGELALEPICDGAGGGGATGGVFKPFEQTCAQPVDGEPAGAAADGEVCTWGAISACTEEGRRYDDYASCDDVRTQRPYVPSAKQAGTPANDPRLTDDAYLAELDWVTSQVESCACICCHSTASAPGGATSDWWLEAEPLWIDTLDDDGLGMLAGWVDSTAFGAFDPADNNGFDRSTTGLPTTDVGRMLTFLEGELARRGLTRDDFTDTRPFGGPLYDQLVYTPSACAAGEGVAGDGTITWNGGAARYVYVMEPDAAAPGVPPNLDLPDGTLWRLDVAYDADPVASGLAYGSTPEGTVQAWPETGAAPALQAGTAYYLYVLRDVYQPLARCTFTFGD